ncbi:MAG TPA: hypothetical protein VJ982_06090 [Gemmatimonadota bacterium]|nr:hypothetical protein [Gemmatimonadota bacterium]
MNASLPVHALLDDLFFRSRIETTAEAAGVAVTISRTIEELLEERRKAGGGAVLIDLGGGSTEEASEHATEAISAIHALRRLPQPPIIVAWGSHVDVEAFEAARAAGADRVLPRSAFTRRLPEILRELAGS